MKRILITGKNSYIGVNIEKWLLKEPKKYHIDTLDMQDSKWKEFSFSDYDVVFHVAGIAHVSKRKALEEVYYKVNRDLTIETAKKAKKAGVKHFIFMSSMIVYNSKETKIDLNTKPNPDNFYGKSKLEAEEGILLLEDEKFHITIMRPPVIYGLNSKGNFSKLIKAAKKMKLFPKFENKRSMLFIDNLSNTIKGVIDNQIFGVLYPQNSNYISTYQIIREVSDILRKKIFFVKIFNPFIYLLKNKISILNKMFSDSAYSIVLSEKTMEYSIVNFKDSIVQTIEKSDQI